MQSSPGRQRCSHPPGCFQFQSFRPNQYWGFTRLPLEAQKLIIQLFMHYAPVNQLSALFSYRWLVQRSSWCVLSRYCEFWVNAQCPGVRWAEWTRFPVAVTLFSRGLCTVRDALNPRLANKTEHICAWEARSQRGLSQEWTHGSVWYGSTVRLSAVRPAASVCRQPPGLRSSACGRRWPPAGRSVSQSSRPAGPTIKRTSGLSACLPLNDLCST